MAKAHLTFHSACVKLNYLCHLFSQSCQFSKMVGRALAINYGGAMQTILCPCNHPTNSISYRRDFRFANYPLMISFLLDIDWLMLQQSCSVDEFRNVFSMKLNECIERFVPLRIVSCSKLPRLKHIRKLLLLKKKWYHKDRVVYKKNC